VKGGRFPLGEAFCLPEYKKGIPLMKISSTEDKKAVPMKLISFP
jgi:hypothetical protein